MPVFTNRPPEDSSGPGLRLRRTPAPGKLTGIVTCRELIGCPTHFYRHRTVPCEPPDCEACKAGHPWRWHGYLSAIDCKTNEHFIFEMTAQAAETFTQYQARHDTLLGCLFEAARLGDRHNGRVLMRCKPADLTKINLPSAPDLMMCLCHIWNIPRPDLKVEGRLKNSDRLTVNRNSNGSTAKAQATQPQT